MKKYEVPKSFIPLYSFTQWIENKKFCVIVSMRDDSRGMYKFYFDDQENVPDFFEFSTCEGYYPDLKKL